MALLATTAQLSWTLGQRRASNQKVAKPWLDSWCVSLRKTPMPSWGQVVYTPLWPDNLTKTANRICIGVVWQTQNIMVHARV